MSPESLPPTLDMPAACELLGCCVKVGYRLVAEGSFPSPVLRLGRRIVIPTQPLLAVLGMDRSSPAHANVIPLEQYRSGDATA